MCSSITRSSMGQFRGSKSTLRSCDGAVVDVLEVQPRVGGHEEVLLPLGVFQRGDAAVAGAMPGQHVVVHGPVVDHHGLHVGPRAGPRRASPARGSRSTGSESVVRFGSAFGGKRPDARQDAKARCRSKPSDLMARVSSAAVGMVWGPATGPRRPRPDPA